MAGFSRLELEPTGHGAVTLGHIGSVEDVLAGRLLEALAERRFRAADYHAGFELASPRDKQSLGESVMVNGTCYATSTDRTSADYQQTIHGHDFVTGGMFLIPHGVEPSHRVTFETTEDPIPLMTLFAEFVRTIGQPGAFVGLAECATIRGKAISKPPIHGVSVLDQPGEYFTHPEFFGHGVSALVMGVFAPEWDPERHPVCGKLDVVFYKGVGEAEAMPATHAHVLTLKGPVRHIDEVGPDQVEKTLHLIADGTTVRAFRGDLYTIRDLIDFQV